MLAFFALWPILMCIPSLEFTDLLNPSSSPSNPCKICACLKISLIIIMCSLATPLRVHNGCITSFLPGYVFCTLLVLVLTSVFIVLCSPPGTCRTFPCIKPTACDRQRYPIYYHKKSPSRPSPPLRSLKAPSSYTTRPSSISRVRRCGWL